MLAVMTSKGQLTLPKGIREHLGLKAGSRLDFQVNEQGWLMARPVTGTALGLAGLLRRPGKAAVSVDAIARAVEEEAAQMNAPASSKAMRKTLLPTGSAPTEPKQAAKPDKSRNRP